MDPTNHDYAGRAQNPTINKSISLKCGLKFYQCGFTEIYL